MLERRVNLLGLTDNLSATGFVEKVDDVADTVQALNQVERAENIIQVVDKLEEATDVVKVADGVEEATDTILLSGKGEGRDVTQNPGKVDKSNSTPPKVEKAIDDQIKAVSKPADAEIKKLSKTDDHDTEILTKSDKVYTKSFDSCFVKQNGAVLYRRAKSACEFDFDQGPTEGLNRQDSFSDATIDSEFDFEPDIRRLSDTLDGKSSDLSKSDDPDLDVLHADTPATSSSPIQDQVRTCKRLQPQCAVRSNSRISIKK